MKKLLIVCGPTGVGKSDFAEKLARKINGEIINADLGQFYEPLSIGTAKPDWKKSDINQHLFDEIKVPSFFNASDYRKRAKECFEDISGRGKVAVFVGGSGFYYQALLWDFSNGLNVLHEKAVVDKKAPSEDLWGFLRDIDPERAEKIHKNDKYRLQRAIDIFFKAGVRPSDIKMTYKPLSDDYLLIHVNRDTKELYDRIEKRTCAMLEQGWIKEVSDLDTCWKDFVRKKKVIGYGDILDYLDNVLSNEELIRAIQKKTRNYAKRQKTFFRSLVKRLPENECNKVVEIDASLFLTLSSIDLYINQLMKNFDIKTAYNDEVAHEKNSY